MYRALIALPLLSFACDGGGATATDVATATVVDTDDTDDVTDTDDTDVSDTDDTDVSDTDVSDTDLPDDTGVHDTDVPPPPNCSPPDANPPATPEGHPTDGWRWTPNGRLFADRPGVLAYDGDLSPTLVDTGSGLHLIYVRQDGAGHSLWATSSTDGVTWDAPVPVTGLADAGNYASLVYDGGTFHLYEGSGSFGHATSTDGVHFTPTDTVLRTPDAGTFANVSLLYPHAVQTPSGVDLWYTGFNGARYAIGRATAPSLGAEASGGVLEFERDTAGWDNTSVGMPMVVERPGVRHMWYGGYDTVIADPGPWRVGYLHPVTGERQIALQLGATGVDAWSTRDPAVVPWGDGWLMVYVGMGDDAIYRLLSATSDVCN